MRENPNSLLKPLYDRANQNAESLNHAFSLVQQFTGSAEIHPATLTGVMTPLLGAIACTTGKMPLIQKLALASSLTSAAYPIGYYCYHYSSEAQKTWLEYIVRKGYVASQLVGIAAAVMAFDKTHTLQSIVEAAFPPALVSTISTFALAGVQTAKAEKPGNTVYGATRDSAARNVGVAI